jgi:hypothetical protein
MDKSLGAGAKTVNEYWVSEEGQEEIERLQQRVDQEWTKLQIPPSGSQGVFLTCRKEVEEPRANEVARAVCTLWRRNDIIERTRESTAMGST